MVHVPLCVNDFTVIPPPCFNPHSAFTLYDGAFRRIVQYCVNSRIEGDVFEFGTWNGYTARTLAQLMYEFKCEASLWLFDSWEGFPTINGIDLECPEVAHHKMWMEGSCKPVVNNIDSVINQALSMIIPGKVKTVKGFYANTLKSPLNFKASIVHIDCDLYESTHLVLKQLLDNNCLSEGTVIMFDDWNNNLASNKWGERRAVKDLFPTAKIELEKWFSYGASGQAFIVQYL